MTTHATYTERYTGTCGTCHGEARYHVASEGGMTVNCKTCDKPADNRNRWVDSDGRAVL